MACGDCTQGAEGFRLLVEHSDGSSAGGVTNSAHRTTIICLFALPLLGGCEVARHEAPDRVSVLVVSLAGVRADHVEPYSAGGAATPALRALAEQGVLFERAYAASPLGLPSTATLLTGLNPPAHGVRDEQGQILGPDNWTLAEQYAEHGYVTAAFTATPDAEARWGLDQGFGVYEDRVAVGAWNGETLSSADVVNETISTLGQLSGPVFAYVQLADATVDDPEVEVSAGLTRYDQAIGSQDAELRRLVAWWDHAYPDSVLVVTADHGLAMGEGGEHGSGALLQDATLRVPLVLRGIGAASGRVPVGEREGDPVGLVDVAPTLLSLTNHRVPRRLEGNDLLDEGSERVYSEAVLGWSRLGLAPLYAYTDAGGRFVQGAWDAWYPAHDGSVAVQADLGPPKPERTEALAALREHMKIAVPVDARPDLADPGSVGGDLSAPPGIQDPRDAVDLYAALDQITDRMAAGQLWLAERRLSELEDRTTDAWGVTALRAQLTLARGRLDEAVAMLSDLYGRHPTEGLALRLGSALACAGRWDEAEAWFDAVLAEDPDQPDAIAGRVHVALARGDRDTAELLLTGVDDDDPALGWARAELLLADGRAADAVQEAERALEARPGSSEALAAVAQARWELGDTDMAIDLFQDAVALDRYDLSLRARLAGYLLELGRPRRAARLLAPAALMSPEGGDVQDLYEEAQEAASWRRQRPPG